MIDTFQTVVLAVLQGLTEFLPISSSGHLVLPSQLLGWPDQGLAYDVAVHVGTLAAVLLYYRRDIAQMATAWLSSLAGAPANDDSRLVWYVGLATIPAGAVGLLAGDFIETHLRHILVIAATTLLFGLLLGYADRRAPAHGEGRALGFGAAMLIGLAQALAPVPGVSRSGVTITAALLLGLDRQDAARFSFLLSIPIIACAGALKGWQVSQGDYAIDWPQLMLAALVSAVTAYSCIALFLRLLDRIGMMPFVYYRIALAGLLLAVWWFGTGA